MQALAIITEFQRADLLELMPSTSKPREADVIRAEAQAFQSLSSTERIEAILNLMESEIAFNRIAPNREAEDSERLENDGKLRKLLRDMAARTA